MSACHGNWDELSSRNERLVRAAEPTAGTKVASTNSAAAQWAELGSQRERLADASLRAEYIQGTVTHRTAQGDGRSASLRLVASVA